MDPKHLSSLTAKVVKEALESSHRVWVYPVNSFHGRKEPGLLALSQDYLRQAVAEELADDAEFKAMANGMHWLKDRLPVEIETVLKRHKVRSGYAVLEGVARSVWVLPQSEFEVGKSKSVRSQRVEVLERI